MEKLKWARDHQKWKDSRDGTTNLSFEKDRAYGFSWPQRNYRCSFCKKEFKSAQALGGHMNVHRRDRARMRLSCDSPNPNPSFALSSTTPFWPYCTKVSCHSPLTAVATNYSPSSATMDRDQSLEAGGLTTRCGGECKERMKKKEVANVVEWTSLGRRKEARVWKGNDDPFVGTLDLNLGLMPHHDQDPINHVNLDLDLELRLGCS